MLTLLQTMMHSACFKKRKLKILLLFLYSITILGQAQPTTPQAVPLITGTTFTSVTNDDGGGIWVGSRANGLWQSTNNGNEITGFTQYPMDANFNGLHIQTLGTTSSIGGRKIWIGHNGRGGNTAPGGGMHMLTVGGAVQHFTAERNQVLAQGMGRPPEKRGGLPSRNCKAIATDKDGGIWAAHGYHDMTVTGSGVVITDPLTGLPTFPDLPGYYVTPGGLGYKRATANVFDNVGMSLPYPAYTINPPIQNTPGTRICLSVACGPQEVWMGFAQYQIDGGGTRTCGIARYSYAGQLLGIIDGFNTPELPFTQTFSGPRAIAIHYLKNGDPCVGFNQNRGFAILKNAIYTNAAWVYVDKLNHYDAVSNTNQTSQLLPNGIRLNNDAPGVISSAGNRLFIGTMDGLLMYKGAGDYRQDSSYVLITTAQGLSSNNIRSITATKSHVYVVTDQGVDKVKIPADMIVFHVRNKNNPYDESNNNYVPIASLTNKTDLSISFTTEDLPMIAADGTTSTVFRYFTNNVDDFYAGHYFYAVNADYYGEDTVRWGKLTLKPRAHYDTENPNYVDFIYRHPLQLNKQLLDQEEELTYKLSIHDRRLGLTVPRTNFDIKFIPPPILMIHGVWSSIKSFQEMEDFFLSKPYYKPFQLLRIYRMPEEENNAENPYEIDVARIPVSIKQLIQNCENGGLSAGKVNIVCHSRGGLYTRAYIQELLSSHPYEDDINALITINTPHSGSQLANLTLDKRIIKYLRVEPIMDVLPIMPGNIKFVVDEIELGKLLEVAIPAEGDRAEKNGSKVLRVDQGLIISLNEEQSLRKIADNKIPVHAIATEFRLCDLPIVACDDLFSSAYYIGLKRVWFLKILLFLLDDAPSGLDNFFKDHVFNGETNDFIVPKSSMEAGLSMQYISKLEGKNIPHVSSFNSVGADGGATDSEFVHARLWELLKENVHDSNGSFTKAGFNPPRGEPGRLEYKFWPWLSTINNNPAPEHRISNTNNLENVEFYIDRSTIGSSLTNGGVINFDIHAVNVDKVMLVYSNNQNDNVHYQNVNVTANPLEVAFTIPADFHGNLTIHAYAANDGALVALDSAQAIIAVPAGVTLDSIFFDGSHEVELSTGTTTVFNLKGKFSDNIVRDISNWSSVNYYIRNTTLATLAGKATLETKEQTGFTRFIAVHNGKADSVSINIVENPVRRNTIITNITGAVANNNILLQWTALQEYKNATFIVERRHSHEQEFQEITTINGRGTAASALLYNYTDAGVANGTIYYRLKMMSTDGLLSYTTAIQLIKQGSTVVTGTDDVFTALSMYPNPSSHSITLKTNLTLPESFILITDLKGSVIRKHGPVNIETTQVVSLDGIAEGLYFVSVIDKQGHIVWKGKVVKK